MRRRNFIQQAVLAGLAMQLPAIAFASMPKSSFDSSSTAEEVTKGLGLFGKTAVVAGCNSGIGHETMRVLAMRGAHVIGTARTLEKGRQACAQVKGKATPVVLELTDFDSVVACATAIEAMHVNIDMLILNAGIVLGQLEQVNGIEKQFVVNPLGHFILAQRLLDRVKGRSTRPGGGHRQW